MANHLTKFGLDSVKGNPYRARPLFGVDCGTRTFEYFRYSLGGAFPFVDNMLQLEKASRQPQSISRLPDHLWRASPLGLGAPTLIAASGFLSVLRETLLRC